MTMAGCIQVKNVSWYGFFRTMSLLQRIKLMLNLPKVLSYCSFFRVDPVLDVYKSVRRGLNESLEEDKGYNKGDIAKKKIKTQCEQNI